MEFVLVLVFLDGVLVLVLFVFVFVLLAFVFVDGAGAGFAASVGALGAVCCCVVSFFLCSSICVSVSIFF